MSDSQSSYWAHSAKQSTPDPDSRIGWQRLAVHLEAVGALAARLAESARPGDERFAALARLSGLLRCSPGPSMPTVLRLLHIRRPCPRRCPTACEMSPAISPRKDGRKARQQL
jgi:hypothetical protein